MKSGAAGRHKDRTGILSFEPLLGSAIPCSEVVRRILGTQFSVADVPSIERQLPGVEALDLDHAFFHAPKRRLQPTSVC